MTTNSIEQSRLHDKIETIKVLYAEMMELTVQMPTPLELEKAREARARLRSRRARDSFFPSGTFADAPWDMLLDLYAAHYERKRVSISSLCIASAVPATTALRHIRNLENKGYFVREIDCDDGRRIFIRLTVMGLKNLDAYFRENAVFGTKDVK